MIIMVIEIIKTDKNWWINVIHFPPKKLYTYALMSSSAKPMLCIICHW